MGADESEFQPANDPVGVRLKRAREALGLSVADLVQHTRVQERFLLAIEAGDYAALPGRAYAFGFARSYAGYVGMDPNAIIRDLRHELGIREQAPSDQLAAAFAPGDPARVPSARFAALAAAAAVLLAGGGYALWHAFSVPDASLPSLVTDTPSATPMASAPAPAPSAPASGAAMPALTGPVVFTALDSGIWVKFYDASGKILLQKQMMAGESYTVPVDAKGPMLWTGRPVALAVSVGGHAIGKLNEARKTVRDLPVSAAALQSHFAAAAPQAPVANGSAMGQANRAAMPVATAASSAPIAAQQNQSAPSGASVPTHHSHHRVATQPAAAPGDGSAAGKASTVSE